MRLLFVFILFANFVFSQRMEIGPLMQNTSISSVSTFITKNEGATFDSTIIFLPDTLQLPFLDEFSTNKFQEYTLDYN